MSLRKYATGHVTGVSDQDPQGVSTDDLVNDSQSENTEQDSDAEQNEE